MINDFREMTNETVIETDICIVGAGAAGISIAKYLNGSNISICLVESGGFEFEEETQSLYQGKNVGRKYFPLDTARLRYFGGTTNHWTGWCSPLEEIDFQQRDWVPYSGWPLTLKDLEPYYIQAQKWCNVGPYRYQLSDWEADDFKLLEVLPEKLATKFWQFSPAPTRFGITYRAELEQATHIQVLLHANVVEVVSNQSAQAVESVKITTLDMTKTGTIRAKVVVLACGALENPRLLLVSNHVQTTGLGNQNDNVGRFFMEHPLVDSARLVTLKDSRSLAYYNNITIRNGTHLRPALKGSEIAQQKYQILNVAVLMYSADGQKDEIGYPAAKKLFKALKSGKFSSQFRNDVINLVNDLDGLAETLYYRFKGTQKPLPDNTNIKVMSYAEQRPNPNSRVLLDSETDQLGLPRIKLDWQLTELDKRSIRITNQLIGEELGRMELGRLQLVDWLQSEDDHIEAGGQYHHMGTTRMSEDPKQGVVDKNCRVHGLANLYIAGSSVFATSGNSNPTLTIVALAMRLAEHLKKQVLS
jgi:choline dehydrogenase-like flavoprotein